MQEKNRYTTDNIGFGYMNRRNFLRLTALIGLSIGLGGGARELGKKTEQTPFSDILDSFYKDPSQEMFHYTAAVGAILDLLNSDDLNLQRHEPDLLAFSIRLVRKDMESITIEASNRGLSVLLSDKIMTELFPSDEKSQLTALPIDSSPKLSPHLISAVVEYLKQKENGKNMEFIALYGIGNIIPLEELEDKDPVLTQYANKSLEGFSLCSMKSVDINCTYKPSSKEKNTSVIVLYPKRGDMNMRAFSFFSSEEKNAIKNEWVLTSPTTLNVNFDPIISQQIDTQRIRNDKSSLFSDLWKRIKEKRYIKTSKKAPTETT